MITVTPKQRQNLFAVTLVLFVIGTVFSETIGIGDFLSEKFLLTVGTISIEKGPMTYFRAFIFLLLLLKIALDTLDNQKIAPCQFIILSLILIQALVSNGRGLLYLYALALASRDVDLKTISKIILWTLTISLVFIALLALRGVIDEIIDTTGQWYRPVRRSLGFKNQNTFALYMLAIIYAYFAYYEPKLKTFFGVVLIAAIAFLISGNRGIVLGVFTLFASFFLFKYTSQKGRKVILFLFPIIVIANLVFLFQFSFGPIESWLDRLSSRRFYYIYHVLQYIPVTPFGDMSCFPEKFGPFDNSYAFYILQYGTVGATILFFSVFFGMLKNAWNVKLLALCATICAVGLIESRLAHPVLSFPIMKIVLDGWDWDFLKKKEAIKG